MPIKWFQPPTTVTGLCDLTDTAMSDDFWKGHLWAKLQYPPWRFFYVDFEVLKQDTDEKELIAKKLQDEWIKVYDFYMLKRGEIERRIEYYNILMIKQDNRVPQDAFKLMLIEIHHLYHFINLNYCAFLRLSIHHDSYSVSLERTLSKKHLWDQFMPLLELVFRINQLVVSTNIHRSTSMTTDSARKTHRYWVHPDNLMEVILFLSTKSSITTGSTVANALYEVGTRKASDSNPARLSTLYFDTPHLTTYKQLCKNNTGSVSRVRWIENQVAMFEQKLYEKGKHSQKWRLWLKQKHLASWIDGDLSFKNVFQKESCEYRTHGYIVTDNDLIKHIKEAGSLLEQEMHEKIPVLKVEQSRLHFILNNSTVFISIDYDIFMNCLISQETKRFPYCVFQISFDETADENEWVQSLAHSDVLKPVDGSSIYLHGVGTLSSQPIQPSWVSQESDIRCFHARGKLVEDDPSIRSSLENRKSIDSITTTDASSDYSNGTQPTLPTIITDQDYLNEKRDPPKRNGSYCSFDHPTSSSSDPTNCKSCMAKLIVPDRSRYEDSPIFKRSRPNDHEITTFGALLLKTFLPRRFKSFEKEPLMSPRYRQYRTFSNQHLEELGRVGKEQESQVFSRAVTLTSVCIILSFSLLYVFYVLISADI